MDSVPAEFINLLKDCLPFEGEMTEERIKEQNRSKNLIEDRIESFFYLITIMGTNSTDPYFLLLKKISVILFNRMAPFINNKFLEFDKSSLVIHAYPLLFQQCSYEFLDFYRNISSKIQDSSIISKVFSDLKNLQTNLTPQNIIISLNIIYAFHEMTNGLDELLNFLIPIFDVLKFEHIFDPEWQPAFLLFFSLKEKSIISLYMPIFEFSFYIINSFSTLSEDQILPKSICNIYEAAFKSLYMCIRKKFPNELKITYENLSILFYNSYLNFLQKFPKIVNRNTPNFFNFKTIITKYIFLNFKAFKCFLTPGYIEEHLNEFIDFGIFYSFFEPEEYQLFGENPSEFYTNLLVSKHNVRKYSFNFLVDLFKQCPNQFIEKIINSSPSETLNSFISYLYSELKKDPSNGSLDDLGKNLFHFYKESFSPNNDAELLIFLHFITEFNKFLSPEEQENLYFTSLDLIKKIQDQDPNSGVHYFSVGLEILNSILSINESIQIPEDVFKIIMQFSTFDLSGEAFSIINRNKEKSLQWGNDLCEITCKHIGEMLIQVCNDTNYDGEIENSIEESYAWLYWYVSTIKFIPESVFQFVENHIKNENIISEIPCNLLANFWKLLGIIIALCYSFHDSIFQSYVNFFHQYCNKNGLEETHCYTIFCITYNIFQEIPTIPIFQPIFSDFLEAVVDSEISTDDFIIDHFYINRAFSFILQCFQHFPIDQLPICKVREWIMFAKQSKDGKKEEFIYGLAYVYMAIELYLSIKIAASDTSPIPEKMLFIILSFVKRNYLYSDYMRKLILLTISSEQIGNLMPLVLNQKKENHVNILGLVNIYPDDSIPSPVDKLFENASFPNFVCLYKQ